MQATSKNPGVSAGAERDGLRGPILRPGESDIPTLCEQEADKRDSPHFYRRNRDRVAKVFDPLWS